jgi:hypothetical protein
MLADGGTCVSDIVTLRRGHDALFAAVASQPTAWRTLEAIADDDLAVHRMFDAVAAVRGRVWRLSATPTGWDDPTVPVYVDIDATLVTAHSEKDRAAGTYKGGFGFAPIMAFVDRGEPLGLLLRPGNAAANTIADNADVLEQALQWLPKVPDGKPVVARGDSAMATCGFVTYARSAEVVVSVSLPLGDHPGCSPRSTSCTPMPTLGSRRSGLTGPSGRARTADIDGHRFTAVLTDLPGADIVALEAAHRARAHIEDRIRDAKDRGLLNLPCGDFDAGDLRDRACRCRAPTLRHPA